MTSRIIASQATERRCRADEVFPVHPGYLCSWDDDLDCHARQFAVMLHVSGHSPPMIMAALGGVGALLAAHWTMVEGRTAKQAVARMYRWRKLVMQKHAWEVIAAAKHAESFPRQELSS